MSYYTVRSSRFADIPPIAQKLREGDRLELVRAYDDPPEKILQDSLKCSEKAWTAFAPDGEPVAMWGVARCRDQPGTGAIWLLGTDRVNEDRTDFLRLSRRYTRIMCRSFHVVCNLVDAEYTQARRWLKWLGFQEGDIVKSAKGFDFIKVYKVCTHV